MSISTGMEEGNSALRKCTVGAGLGDAERDDEPVVHHADRPAVDGASLTALGHQRKSSVENGCPIEL